MGKDIEAPIANVTPWLVFSVFSAAFGSSFLFGYNIGVLNAPQNILGEWIRQTKCRRNGGIPSTEEGESQDLWCMKLDQAGEAAMFRDNVELNTLWAVINSLIPGGAIVGALVSPFFARRIGPKRSMLLNNALAILAVLMTSLSRTANSYEMLIVGRLVAGINSGINVSLSPTYLSEISPARLRGAIGSVHQLAFTVSVSVSQILGLPFIFGNAQSWPYLLAMAAVPTAYQLVTMPFCPDSPKYLFFGKRDEEGARTALQTLRGSLDVKLEMADMELEHEKAQLRKVVTIRRLFTDPFLRRTMFIAFGLLAFQQLSGINSVMFYSTSVYQSAGLSGSIAVYATIGTGIIYVIMTGIALILVEKAGRRTLLLIGNTGMIVFMVLLTITMLLYKIGMPGPEFPAASNPFALAAYASCACVVLFVVMFATGPGAVPWIMMSELFAQGPRSAAAGILAASNRFFALTVTLAFPYLQAAIGEYSFIIFSTLLTVALGFTYVYVIETKGKSIDEIQLELRSRMPSQQQSVVAESTSSSCSSTTALHP